VLLLKGIQGNINSPPKARRTGAKRTIKDFNAEGTKGHREHKGREGLERHFEVFRANQKKAYYRLE
jgi:hypothetical protein